MTHGLIDSHCHIHDEAAFTLDTAETLNEARAAGVTALVCIGTDAKDSESAVHFAQTHSGVWASVGLHPHSASIGEDELEAIVRLIHEPKVVALGEFGLDYYYNNAPRDDQIRALEYQLDLAYSYNKPCVFHVREAFDDFFAVLANTPGIQGVVHSFTGTYAEMERIIDAGLHIGCNGIMTFSKDPEHKKVAQNVPLERMLLETDSPFLTPVPKRGTMNTPANVRLVAAYLAELRGETLESLIEATTQNTQTLFHLTNDFL